MSEGEDRAFRFFIVGVFATLLLFGVGMTIVIIWGDPNLAAKMLNIFSGMFGATVGLGTGYLVGRNRP